MDVQNLIDKEGAYETIAYYAKGHVDKAEFCEEIKREYEQEFPQEKVEHILARKVPYKDEDGDWGWIFQVEYKPGHGVFKATYIELEGL